MAKKIKTIYVIKHCYDVAGEFDDAVYVESPLFATENKELAYAYVEKYHDPVLYDDSHYVDLYHHGLCVREMKFEEPDLDISPWRENNPEESEKE